MNFFFRTVIDTRATLSLKLYKKENYSSNLSKMCLLLMKMLQITGFFSEIFGRWKKLNLLLQNWFNLL